jgi:hypothetical protein
VRLEEGKVRVTHFILKPLYKKLGRFEIRWECDNYIDLQKARISFKYDKETVYPIKREAFSYTLSDSQLPKDFSSPQNYFPESNDLKTIQKKT